MRHTHKLRDEGLVYTVMVMEERFTKKSLGAVQSLQPLLSVLGFALVFLALSFSFMSVRDYFGVVNNPMLPYFLMRSWKSSSSQEYGDFEVMQNRKRFFSYSDIAKISDIEGVSSVQAEPLSSDSRLLIERNNLDEYWQTYQSPLSESSLPSPKNLPNDVVAISEVAFITLSQSEIDKLAKQHSLVLSDEFYSGHSALLFCPVTAQGKKNQLSFESLRIGRLESMESEKLLSEISTNSLNFIDGSLCVEDIFNKSFILQLDGNSLSFDKPTIVMSQKAVGEKIFGGFVEVAVAEEAQISKQSAQQLKSILQKMATKHPDYLFQDLAETRNDMLLLAIPALIGTGIAALLTTLLCLISIIFAIRGSLLLYIREIEILRYLGISKFEIKRWFYSYLSFLSFLVVTVIVLLMIKFAGLLENYYMSGVIAVLLLVGIALITLFLSEGQLNHFLPNSLYKSERT